MSKAIFSAFGLRVIKPKQMTLNDHLTALHRNVCYNALFSLLSLVSCFHLFACLRVILESFKTGRHDHRGTAACSSFAMNVTKSSVQCFTNNPICVVNVLHVIFLSGETVFKHTFTILYFSQLSTS